MNLLYEINNEAKKVVLKHEIIDKNIDLLEQRMSMTTHQLNETVTNWLASILGVLSKGEIDPNKKEQVIKILGALQAVSNPDLAEALDEKGDLAIILQQIGDRNKDTSNAALHRMMEIGNHPSVKSFISNAQQALNNSNSATQYIKKIQTNIDQVMRQRLFNQRKVK